MKYGASVAARGTGFVRFRLRALADAPTAFSSRLADESSRPQAVWDEAAATRSEGDSAATFVAEVDGSWVGLAGGYRAGAGPDVELVSMWVAPGADGWGSVECWSTR